MPFDRKLVKYILIVINYTFTIMIIIKVIGSRIIFTKKNLQLFCNKYILVTKVFVISVVTKMFVTKIFKNYSTSDKSVINYN